MSELSISALMNAGGEMLQRAHASLKEQARLIDRLSGSIGDNFAGAARLLDACTGQVVVAVPESLARAGVAIAAALEASGFDARPVAGPAPDELAGHLCEQDLLLLVDPEPAHWLAALARFEGPIVILGGEEESFTTCTRVQLPVCIDRSGCPDYLFSAVSELAFIALGDALIAALGRQGRRAAPEI
ncbi:hypothetical protein [Marinobacterium aestuariivivens]|uniref:Uncharacterized protein n=1 Tax=Marinobacterium aestuariivivens TaxID=1698799 RepID=A0ABW1ZUR0_9GAMM